VHESLVGPSRTSRSICFYGRCWVRIDKTHNEHNESGHPPIADIGPTSISVVKGQKRNSLQRSSFLLSRQDQDWQEF
jgi:hypothetical protein